MKMRSTLCAFALAASISGANAPAGRAEEPPPKDVVAGTVTKVDPATRRVTIQSPDGGTQEFEASRETLDELRPGDRIEAKKRSAPEAQR